jgi:hypothetical protein
MVPVQKCSERVWQEVMWDVERRVEPCRLSNNLPNHLPTYPSPKKKAWQLAIYGKCNINTEVWGRVGVCVWVRARMICVMMCLCT